MPNLAKQLEATADGPILFAVIGKDLGNEPAESPLFGQCSPWSEVRAALDYEYGIIEPPTEWGDERGADFAVYAWTAERVLFLDEYDGMTQIVWVPRNPVPCEPEFGGIHI